MNFQQLKADLTAICKAFNLGELRGYRTEQNTPTEGFNTAYFDTEKESNLKYYYTEFKPLKQQQHDKH